MRPDPLVPLSLSGFAAFFAVLAVIIGGLLWYLHLKEKKVREQFFSQFDTAQLRMSPYKIGIVYRLVSVAEAEVVVIPVWDGKVQVENGKEQNLSPDVLIPFDESRFF